VNPRLIPDNAANLAEVDAVFTSQGAVTDTALRIALANLIDLGPRQFSPGVIFATKLTPFCNLIRHIVRASPEEQMARMNTETNIAPVQYAETVWNWPVPPLPNDMVGKQWRSILSARVDLPITVMVRATGPKPAVLSLVNLWPESFFERLGAWWHRILPLGACCYYATGSQL